MKDATNPVIASPVFARQILHEDFAQMESLEASFYSSELITPADEAFRWYVRHPHSIVAAMEPNASGAIAGFINLLPVRKELFEQIAAGTFNDAALTAEDILPLEALETAPFGLFLSCIVVEERYQKTGLAYRLFEKALEPYLPYLPRNIVVDAATEAGERFSRNLGLRRVRSSDHGTCIYQGVARRT